MPIQFHGTRLALTPDDVRQFEETLVAPLPNDYRRFLLDVNGGAPEPSVFRAPAAGNVGSRLTVDYFLALGGIEPPAFAR